MTEHIMVRIALTAEQIESLDRMVATSGTGSRTGFINSIVREVIADEMADQAAEKAA